MFNKQPTNTKEKHRMQSYPHNYQQRLLTLLSLQHKQALLSTMTTIFISKLDKAQTAMEKIPSDAIKKIRSLHKM